MVSLALRPKAVDFEAKWGQLEPMVQKIIVRDQTGIPKVALYGFDLWLKVEK